MRHPSKPLVLVMDKDSTELTDLYALLDREGYLVATRLSGIEALKYVSQHKPELVVISGRSISEEELSILERTKSISPRTHVVLLCSHGGWPQFMDVVERGGDDLILKPFKNEEVLNAVRRATDRARQERPVSESASAF
ncbi:MAG TPA: response regulator [Planctomycetota bacterium]|nr:response regulator [Planctomycetota bacterium]